MTKKKLLAPLFLAASFLIVGCSASEIIARPSWIDEPIVVNPGDEKYKDNTLKEIYDAIKKLGDTNANVLNKVMYEIAQKQLAPFEDYEIDKVKYKGLKSMIWGHPTDDDINKFVEKFPIYKSDDKIYQRVNVGTDDEKVNEIDISDAATHAEERKTNTLAKIEKQYERIMDDVYRKLFEEIKGGSYSTKFDKLFQEDLFVQHLYKEMYYDKYNPDETPKHLVKNRVFIPKKANEEWENYVNAIGDTAPTGFLHVTDSEHNFTEYYSDYIGRKVLPEIYRTLLIENYVREQRATNLGRSYARKVNMISIARSSDPNINSNIREMLQSYSNEYIANATDFTNYDLEYLAQAMTGFAPTSTEHYSPYYLLEEANFERFKITDINGVKREFVWKILTDENGLEIDNGKDTFIYKGTKLYDVIEKFTKIFNIVFDGDKSGSSAFSFYLKSKLNADELSAYNDLTSNGTIPIDRAIVLKERELRTADVTQDGWFLKSGGLSELGEKFRNKLFEITTANIVDKQMNKSKPDINDTVRYFGNDTKEHGVYVNKKAFVYDDKGQQGEAYKSIVLEDDKSFYIVEVLEAASASKLSKEDNGSYLRIKATTEPGISNGLEDEVVRRVTEQVANSDTFKKNAEQYYLMISNIVFYDQSVYDYFKSQFPDLFK